MAEIFISYKRQDPDSESLIQSLQAELGSYGYTVFVDRKMASGILWRAELHRRIKRCEIFLLLVSEAAAKSEEVLEELRKAHLWFEDRGKPRILPVLVNCAMPGGEMGRRISAINCLPWRSEADTPRVVDAIREMISPRRRRWMIQASAAAGVLLAAALLFFYVRHQIAVLRDPGANEASAVAAYRRLKLAPWLHGDTLMRGYFEREARALEQQADALFRGEQERDNIDRALMLSALAAVKRGGAPSPSAQNVYRAQNYGRLIATIRERDDVAGVGLAVEHGRGHWRIAAAGRIWTCADPLGAGPCGLTKQSTLSAVTAAVFPSDDEALLVDSSSGRATRLRLGDKSPDELRQTGVTDVAAGGGEVALAYETAPSVIVDRADGTQEKSPQLGDVAAVRFGPCADCISVLDAKGRVAIWYRTGKRVEPVGGRPALAIAAVRNGRLAVVRDNGHLEYYGPQFAPGPEVDFRAVAVWVAMSADAKNVAVVYDGAVRVAGEDADLISRELRPSAVSAAFAGDMLVTRSSRDIRIWRLGSAQRENLRPIDLWTKWRKQLGLAEAAPPGFGWDPAAGDVRRY